jgi:hypothetical protein
MPEIAVASTGRDHEIVISHPGIPQDHFAHCSVYVGYLAEQDTNIGLIAKHSADGSGDVGRGKAGSGYLSYRIRGTGPAQLRLFRPLDDRAPPHPVHSIGRRSRARARRR